MRPPFHRCQRLARLPTRVDRLTRLVMVAAIRSRKRGARLMGGDITVTKEHRKGSTFSVTVPVAVPEASKPRE